MIHSMAAEVLGLSYGVLTGKLAEGVAFGGQEGADLYAPA